MSRETTTNPPLPDIDRDLVKAWPAEDYRQGQKQIYYEAAAALYGDNDFDTVVIDAPTGLGKSIINTALCNLASKAFYTTPQTELREQLDTDDLISSVVKGLKAREDYRCDKESDHLNDRFVTCDECSVNKSNTLSCRNFTGCRYWEAKEEAMEANTAVLTFAYLRLDGFIPVKSTPTHGMTKQSSAEVVEGNQSSIEDFETSRSQGGQRISFDDRELLVVDEAHSIEGQFASLFAGFSLTPATTPILEDLGIGDALRGGTPQSIFDAAKYGEQAPIEDHIVDGEIVEILIATKEQAEDGLRKMEIKLKKLQSAVIRTYEKQYTEEERERDLNEGLIEFIEDLPDPKVEPEKYFGMPLEELREQIEETDRSVSELSTFIHNVEQLSEEGYDSDENPWMINVELGDWETYTFNPVYVSDLLQNQIWSRADKVILSSATIPSYGGHTHEEGVLEWVEQLGRDPDTTHVITEESPFPVENRRVRLDYLASMSNDGFGRNVDRIAKKIRSFSQFHDGQKGLIHVSSYEQAKLLGEALEELDSSFEKDVMIDTRDHDNDQTLSSWLVDIYSDGNVEDEPPQILITPSMKEGVDLKYKKCEWQVAAKVPYPNLENPRTRYLKENRVWDWYGGKAMTELVQAAGRGVRSPDDKCEFYVLDEAFKSVWRLAPEWYQDAVTAVSRPDRPGSE